MASHYHNRFHQASSMPSPEQEDQIIDPNLYGPFGARYHDDHPHIHPQETSGWHEVDPQTQQHHMAQAHDHHGAVSSNDLGQPSGTWDADNSHAGYTQSISEKPLMSSPASTPMHEVRMHGHGHEKSNSLFDIVHGKKNATKPHIVEHGEELPINFGHLIKRPVIRQWIHGGHLYREKDERKPSQFELFFDLIFVAVVNGLGHSTAESSSAINAFKFVLSFWPCFSIWTDVRTFLNTSGTDDVIERIALLGWMILLCGYCANVSGVKLVYATQELLAKMQGEESGVDTSSGEGLEEDAGEHHRRALFSLLRRAGGGASTEDLTLSQPAFGGYWFTSGYEKAIHAAIAFFLVAKLWRLGLYLHYGIALPKFRRALWLNALAMSLIAAIYIPVLFTSDPLIITLLMVGGIVAELVRSYSVAAMMMCFHSRTKRSGNHMFIPALSHEHSIERYVLFVILIVGESIISSAFVATEGHYGLNSEFGRAALGITISFLITWLYYDADGSRVFQHALRRNSFTSITFCHIHFPLTASLILMAASLSRLINGTDEVAEGYVWYFGGSLSCVIGCIGLIGLMHRNLDIQGSNFVPRWMRLAVRFLCAAAFAIIPIKGDWEPLYIMGIYAGILAAMVAFETVGKVGAVGRRFDAKKAEEIAMQPQRKSKLDRRASWHPFDDLTGTEKGEEDVGIESEIGHLEEKKLNSHERWAYAA